MVLCLGEPSGGLCDVGCCCCCFSSLEVFMFSGYFSMPSALHPGFSGTWRPPLALSSTLATFDCFTFARLFRHSFTASTTVFLWAFFTHRCFLPYAPSPKFLTRFCYSDVGRNTPSRILLCACPTELSLLADTQTWTTHIVVTRPLIYQLHLWATKYKVKIELLNIFCLFKVICKDYKNTLNKTWYTA